MMCRRARREVEIPSDLLEEILYRLRSDDLLNFKLVCKDWERLISSPGFIKKHLERSNAFMEKHLERSNAEYNGPRILISVGCDGEIFDCSDISTTKVISLGIDACLLGSCDGLVLYYDSYKEVIGAVNLSTGKYEERTPNPSIESGILYKLMICSWFGHHPSIGEYVLVLASLYESDEGEASKPKGVVFEVYSLSRNDTDSLISSSSKELDWDMYQGIGDVAPITFGARRVESGDFNHNIGAALLKGRVHCAISLSSTNDIEGEIAILAYDLGTNGIIQMATPLKYCYALGVIEGYLCALDLSTVWVMLEYGVEESWTEYADVHVANIMTHATFCPNGDVVSIDNFDRASVHFFRDGERVRLNKEVAGSSVACVDSLVSPAFVWNRKEE